VGFLLYTLMVKVAVPIMLGEFRDVPSEKAAAMAPALHH